MHHFLPKEKNEQPRLRQKQIVINDGIYELFLAPARKQHLKVFQTDFRAEILSLSWMKKNQKDILKNHSKRPPEDSFEFRISIYCQYTYA